MEDACTSQTVEEDYEDDNKSEQIQPKKRRKRNREKKINVDGLRDFVPKQISSKNSFWHFSKVKPNEEKYRAAGILPYAIVESEVYLLLGCEDRSKKKSRSTNTDITKV